MNQEQNNFNIYNNNEISNNQQFGETITNIEQNTFQSVNSQDYNMTSQQNLISEDELLKEFIGNNYKKITTRLFNFPGFFFTTLYMFYRKIFSEITSNLG